MATALKEEIKQQLQALLADFNQLSPDELANKISDIYEKSLIQSFVFKQELEHKNLLNRVEAAAQSAKTMHSAQAPADTKTIKTTDSGFSNNPEVKVLPHPEGPPLVQNNWDEDPPFVPEPKLNAEEPKTKITIAERAQAEGGTTPTLNERLATQKLSFGLNDRIAYVKHLFGGKTEDFTRVVNQLNTFENWEEAEYFVNEMVKPDYDWNGKEEFEKRFLAHIKTKFV